MIFKLSTVAFATLLLSGCSDSVVQTTTSTTLTNEGADAKDDKKSDSTLQQDETGMTWDHSEFGKTADGKMIEQYVLKNSHGTVVKLINYGATVVSLETVDRDGKPGNIVLGHSSVDHWLDNPCYFGCTVGRFGNRIAKGIFGLGDNVYTLAKNDGENHLHGGEAGFSRRLWEAEATSTDTSVTVTFRRISPDSEDRYPGDLDTTVAYTLSEDNELKIHYEATTDKPTVVNLTNHCYWNLTGNAAEQDVLDHILTLRCNQYLPVDETLIPTGDMVAVAETPMNFTGQKTIGADLPGVEGGYDHCFVINREVEGLVPAARVFEPKSGRVLKFQRRSLGFSSTAGIS